MKKLLIALATGLMLVSGTALAAVNVNTASADELAQLEADAKDELEALRAMPVAPPEIEERSIRPRKSDLAVDSLALCWLPFRGGEPAWR